MHLTQEQDDYIKANLLGKKGVLGFDHEVKKKITNGQVTDQDCVVIYVKKKIPKGEIAPEDLVDETVEGVVTDVIEVGTLVAHAQGRTGRYRPFPMGVSIGAVSVTAGSGAFLMGKSSTGEIGCLTNFHVGKNQEDVLQPGRHDGGRDPDDRVGKSTGIPIPVTGGKIDAAIVVLSSRKVAMTEILGVGVPKGINLNPQVGMKIKCSSRTNGVLEGTITSVSATLSIQYDDGVKTLDDLILCTKVGEPGSSGSGYVEEQLRAVGVHFAGSDQVSVGCKIGNVLEAYPDWELITVEIAVKYGPAAIKLGYSIESEPVPPPPPVKVPLLEALLDKSIYPSAGSMKISGSIKDPDTLLGIDGKVIVARSNGFALNPHSAVSEAGNFTINSIPVRVVSELTEFEVDLSFAGDP